MAATAGFAVVSLVSAGVSAYSASQQADAISKEGAAQQQLYGFNERAAQLNASDAIARGNKDATTHEKSVMKLRGNQRASLAAQGIDPNSGSAADIIDETTTLGALDAMTIRGNAAREAWGYKMQAQEYNSKGQFVALETENKRRNTLLTGGIQAAGQLANGFQRYQDWK